MTAPTAPSPQPVAAQPAQAAAPIKVEVVELPPALADRVAAAGRALTVSGTVTASSADGLATVRLPEGEAVIKLPLPVQVGRPLSLILAAAPTGTKPTPVPQGQPAPQAASGSQAGPPAPPSPPASAPLRSPALPPVQALATGPALTIRAPEQQSRPATTTPHAGPKGLSQGAAAGAPSAAPGSPAAGRTAAPPPSGGNTPSPPAPPAPAPIVTLKTLLPGPETQGTRVPPVQAAATGQQPAVPATAPAPASGIVPQGPATPATPSPPPTATPSLLPAGITNAPAQTDKTTTTPSSRPTAASPDQSNATRPASASPPAPGTTAQPARPAPIPQAGSDQRAPQQAPAPPASKPETAAAPRTATQPPAPATQGQPAQPPGHASLPQAGNAASIPASQVRPAAPEIARPPVPGMQTDTLTSPPQPATENTNSGLSGRLSALKAVFSGLAGRQPGASLPRLESELPLPPPEKLDIARLGEMVDRLGQVDPGALTQGRAPIIPQPGGQLTASLIFFIAALRGGNFRSFVGERGAAALESAGAGDLLGRLSADFTGASRLAGEAPPGDWRSLTIPFQNGQQLSEITLHYHPGQGGDQGDGEEDEEGGGKRIMVDFSLSRSGPMRLDGLLRDKRFDLIVRSLSAMPDWMRSEVSGIFAKACEASGLAGTVSFRAGSNGWMREEGPGNDPAMSRIA